MVDMGISSNIMKSLSPKCLHDILGHHHIQWHRQLIRHYTKFENVLPNWTLLPILTLLPSFGGFHRTLQRMRLANRGRLLLRTLGTVPLGNCICSNVETILSWTRHVYGPFEFWTSLGTSILPFYQLFTIINTIAKLLVFLWNGINFQNVVILLFTLNALFSKINCVFTIQLLMIQIALRSGLCPTIKKQLASVSVPISFAVSVENATLSTTNCMYEGIQQVWKNCYSI